MASLDKLPRELLDLILQYTTPSCQRKLVYICRLLHQIAQLHIYRKIHITLRPEDAQDRNTVIVQLFRTVGTRPLLASYVHELEIFGSKPLILSTQLSEDQARSCMRKMAFSDVAMMHWFNRLMKGDTDAIVAGLISFLGNLKVLRLGFDIWSDSRYLRTTFLAIPYLEEIELSSSIMASAPLSENERDYWDNLSASDKTLIFKTSKGPIYYDPKQFENLFLRPRIKKISLMIPEPRDNWFLPPPNVPPESGLKLTRLCLQQSELTPLSLSWLLRLTPSLRELEYDHWINSVHGSRTMRYFQCADMDAALQPVLRSLERLCIKVQFFLTEARDLSLRYPRGIQGTIKSLIDFSCLTYLEIPVVLLLGWTPTSVGGITQLATVLPPSIRNLTLTTDQDPPESYKWTREELSSYVGDYVKTVSAAASLQAPKNLQRISLHLRDNGELDPEHDPSMSKLKDICVDADISLYISEYCW